MSGVGSARIPALARELVQRASEKSQTLAFAESCTSGLLSAAIGAVPGASVMFQGAVVSYSNEVKRDVLGVSENSLKSFGAVSEEVAVEMAQGARAQLKADWSLAITGIAGPSGGSVAKPVGTVCFAVLGPSVEAQEKQLFTGDRTDIQNQAVVRALEILLHYM